MTYVFDAETGQEIMNYPLAPPFSTIINNLAITGDAVYFTDFWQPFLYRLPLSENECALHDLSAAGYRVLDHQAEYRQAAAVMGTGVDRVV